MPIKLIIADDHPLILDALESLFLKEEDFKVLASCVTGEQTLEALREHQPDVLVLDIRMSGKDGLQVLREMPQNTNSRTVILTAGLDEDETLEAIRLGVSGVVLKEMAPKLLVQCIRKVHAGEKWLERRSFSQVLEKMVRREQEAHHVAGLLSRREIEVTQMVARGLRNKEIGQRLFISEGTVKVHLHNIYGRLEIDSRLALTLYARQKGIESRVQ